MMIALCSANVNPIDYAGSDICLPLYLCDKHLLLRVTDKQIQSNFLIGSVHNFLTASDGGPFKRMKSRKSLSKFQI